MEKKFEKVCIIGLGYIGLPTSAVIARKGMSVVGVDIKEDVIQTINKGKIHIVEPYLESVVKNVVQKKLLIAQKDPVPADVFLIATPTPFTKDMKPDTTYVIAAITSILPTLSKGNLLIIESTCPIGTTEKAKDLIFSKRPELKGFLRIAYCPERVLPGKILHELEHNDRVIGGIDPESTEDAMAFYRKFVVGNLHPTTARTAEMCKLAENAYRDVNIAFANELSIIAETEDINVWELIKLANKHPRVNILQPGTGVGGHCIAVDPWFIVADHPQDAKLIKQARNVNDAKTEWVKTRIEATINAFKVAKNRKPKVALLGLAFKPNVDDLRESPALNVVTHCVQKLEADFLISEPNIEKHPTLKLTPFDEAYATADIAIFLVSHRHFEHLAKKSTVQELDFCGIRQ